MCLIRVGWGELCSEQGGLESALTASLCSQLCFLPYCSRMLFHAATRAVMVNPQQGRLQALNTQGPSWNIDSTLYFPKNFLWMFRLFLQKCGASLDNACNALRQGFLPTTNMFQWWDVTFTSHSSSVKGHESSPCYTGMLRAKHGNFQAF